MDDNSIKNSFLEDQINELRKKKNAIILAHYYQDGDIQDIADFVGDSLDLSKKAAVTECDVIVFCGVRFMAEVAKILSPEKTVLLPDYNAGCSLEESCPPRKFKIFKNQNPEHTVVSYINCSADIKSLSDIIVTSSNAKKIIESLPKNEKIIFAPDKHLGRYLNKITGRKMLLWDGFCIVHEMFSEKEMIKLKIRNEDAEILAHPECPEKILDQADHIGSTSSLLKRVSSSSSKKFIIATEPHIIHQMKKIEPSKTYIPAPSSNGECSCANCPFMELNTMEKLRNCLVNFSPVIEMDKKMIINAKKPLIKMLELS